MEKLDVKQYVDLMNKYEEQAKLGITMIFTSEEQNLMKYMKKMAIKDKELNAFLNQLTDMTPNERYIAIDKHFHDEKKEAKEFITLEEVKDYKEEIASKSKEERNKLNYLINNYSKLKIQGIRLEDLKYLDENGKLKDIDFKSEPIKEVKETPHRSKRYEVEELYNEKTELPKIDKPEKENKPIAKEKNKKSGILGAILLFLLTGFAGAILATILTLILSK